MHWVQTELGIGQLPGHLESHLFKSQNYRNLRDFSFGEHKTTEQTKVTVLSQSDVYFSSPHGDAQLDSLEIGIRHLDNPEFFRQSQQHASKSLLPNTRFYSNYRIAGKSMPSLGYNRCCNCSSCIVPPPTLRQRASA